jgi:hypothetical protein
MSVHESRAAQQRRRIVSIYFVHGRYRVHAPLSLAHLWDPDASMPNRMVPIWRYPGEMYILPQDLIRENLFPGWRCFPLCLIVCLDCFCLRLISLKRSVVYPIPDLVVQSGESEGGFLSNFDPSPTAMVLHVSQRFCRVCEPPFLACHSTSQRVWVHLICAIYRPCMAEMPLQTVDRSPCRQALLKWPSNSTRSRQERLLHRHEQFMGNMRMKGIGIQRWMMWMWRVERSK